MQLSKHFKLEEFTKSMTATRKGISNEPGSGDVKNLENVCYEILEPVRAKFDKPLIITSGYRSEELCEAIGSKKTSQHAKGQAVDFEIPGIPYQVIVPVIVVYLCTCHVHRYHVPHVLKKNRKKFEFETMALSFISHLHLLDMDLRLHPRRGSNQVEVFHLLF